MQEGCRCSSQRVTSHQGAARKAQGVLCVGDKVTRCILCAAKTLQSASEGAQDVTPARGTAKKEAGEYCILEVQDGEI